MAAGGSGSADKSGGGGGRKKGAAARSGDKSRRTGTRTAGKKKQAAAGARPDPVSLVGLFTDIAESAMNFASLGGSSLRLGKALLSKSPESIKAMQEAGAYLKDLREVAGMTQRDLSEALEMRDASLIDAVENGTATLSFELILRLAALLARHDPIPFILRFTRTYRPELWQILDDWGIGRVPVQFERERHFINMYRSHDAARRLSDEGFDKVLRFTRSAFEAALHFAAEMEGLSDEPADEQSAKSKQARAGGKKES